MFYADTAMGGGFEGTRCGLDYFGPDHVVFATDAPVGGPITDMFRVIDRLGLEANMRERICFANAETLMKTTFA